MLVIYCELEYTFPNSYIGSNLGKIHQKFLVCVISFLSPAVGISFFLMECLKFKLHSIEVVVHK